MGRERIFSWWLLAAVVVIAIIGWVLYAVWSSPQPRRDDLATYGAFAAALIITIPGVLAWARRKEEARHSDAAPLGRNLEPLADQLAAAVQVQWAEAAAERGLTGGDPIRVKWARPLLPVAGPAAAAAVSQQFRLLPGMDRSGERDLISGQAVNLYELFGGLRSGRLIITGPPGSGKSGAAILLLLAALRHREEAPTAQRPDVPVPVLFTVQDWNPKRQPVADWLIGKMQATYPFLAGTARASAVRALLVAGRIMVILDGLDEISPLLRPAAVQALNRQASTFRLVLLSRTNEMAGAVASKGVLQGAAAVELKAVDLADAVRYLRQTQPDPPRPGWQALKKRMLAEFDSPLSQALNSPLTLTLVRDTYHGDDIQELLDFCDTLGGAVDDQAAAAITGHLLDRVLPAAYAFVAGQPPPPYDLPTAKRALTAIAIRMNERGTRDLDWWQLFKWVSNAPRVLGFGLTSGLVAGLAAGLARGVLWGLGFGSLVAIYAGLMVLTTGELSLPTRPQTIGRFHLRKALSKGNIMSWICLAITTGVLFGLGEGLVAGVVLGAGFGLGFALVEGLGDALEADSDTFSSLGPATSWQNTLRYGLIGGVTAGVATALAAGVAVGLWAGLESGPGAGAAAGLVFGLVIGPLVGFSTGLMRTKNWGASLVFMQLAIECGTPVRLMKFLDDAHTRNVLRAVGPSYQFRHARLQDRLAAASTTKGATAQAGTTEQLSRPSSVTTTED